jgi:hypothetical protein
VDKLTRSALAVYRTGAYLEQRNWMAGKLQIPDRPLAPAEKQYRERQGAQTVQAQEQAIDDGVLRAAASQAGRSLVEAPTPSRAFCSALRAT